MNFFSCTPRRSHEEHANGPIAEICKQGWLVQAPEDEPNACAFYRSTWKRRYFVLSLVKAPSTCMANHYQLRYHSKPSRLAAKGSIGLDRVTDLCTMVLPPDHLLDRLDYKYYASYQHPGQHPDLPLHQQREVCEQLPLFSFEAEWRRVRRKFYLLAEEARDMLEWVKSLRDACGLADRQEDDDAADILRRMSQPLVQPLTPSPKLPHHQPPQPVWKHQEEDSVDGIYRVHQSPDEGGDVDGIYFGNNARQASSEVVPEITEDPNGNPDPNHGDEYGVPVAKEDEYGVPVAKEDEYGVPVVKEDEYGVPDANEDEYGVPGAHEDAYGVPGANEDDYGEHPAPQSRRKESSSSSRGGLTASELPAQPEPEQPPPPDVTPRQFRAAAPASDEAPQETAEVNTDYENLSIVTRAIRAAVEPEKKEARDDVYGNLS